MEPAPAVWAALHRADFGGAWYVRALLAREGCGARAAGIGSPSTVSSAAASFRSASARGGRSRSAWSVVSGCPPGGA
jgi:hypothetical protein